MGEIVHKIILCRGIQGSGKSTWAKAWVAEDPLNRIRFNNDDIRESQGVYWPSDKVALDKKEKAVAKIKQFAVRAYMDAGYDVVLDNMNLNPKERAWAEGIVDEYNSGHDDKYAVETKDFFIPVEECIARDSMRQHPIGEKVIRQTWCRYRTQIITESVNKMLDGQVKFVEGLPSCIIADMDATLSYNVTGRPFFGDGAADGMTDDVENPSVIKLVKCWLASASEKDRVFVITGREATVPIVTATEKFVREHVSGDKRLVVIYRPVDDRRAGTDVKRESYEKVIAGKYNVDFVVDDSQKIVDMYRSIGLTVLQPNAGMF